MLFQEAVSATLHMRHPDHFLLEAADAHTEICSHTFLPTIHCREALVNTALTCSQDKPVPEQHTTLKKWVTQAVNLADDS